MCLVLNVSPGDHHSWGARGKIEVLGGCGSPRSRQLGRGNAQMGTGKQGESQQTHWTKADFWLLSVGTGHVTWDKQLSLSELRCSRLCIHV